MQGGDVPASLLARGRAAYRNLFRAGRVAFKGDPSVLLAFRQRARDEFIAGRPIQNAALYEKKIRFANECACVVRRNIVQATNDAEDEHLWRIRWRDGVELGDNETIKRPLRQTNDPCEHANLDSTRSQRIDSLNNIRPVTLKQLLNAHRERKIPQLYETDIEESFVRGSGPGGQAINKTRSNVALLHKPTGIRVTCQETRSLETNRKLARRLLQERLDQMYNPGLSQEQIKWARERERKRRRAKKTRRKNRAS
ncbi:RF-1 domain-containing protein [Cantharellus anzutake]|uniref:RF-1 domain-containing protein n=1 Tax=Cantharellus anzutake TaxID=1750568 RepID=UPI0019049BA4|nr:RF-1 domain-containing protein [Cantharellus anzutake]KAF8334284.1 RF-1 domain-containing protein [Cantharellus anzutake]